MELIIGGDSEPTSSDEDDDNLETLPKDTSLQKESAMILFTQEQNHSLEITEDKKKYSNLNLSTIHKSKIQGTLNSKIAETKKTIGDTKTSIPSSLSIAPLA